MRKLVLVGFLLLIRLEYTLLRLVIAILITVTHILLVQAASPYKQASTSLLAVMTGLTLFCTLFAALLVKMYSHLDERLFAFSGATLNILYGGEARARAEAPHTR